MPRFRTIALVVFIAALVLLPLYEFADIGEQWPNDAELVTVVFTGLFIVAALVACRGWAHVCLGSRPRIGVPGPRARVRPLSAHRDRSSLFLILCHFRI